MTATQPARYDIEALLNKGVQPLDDLDPDALKELGKGIGRGPLAIPVSVTENGTLIDGHQRLKAMLGNGRKFIDANDVRVIPGATEANALEWAVRLNVQRRHLTVEQKADLARKLQATRGWSQGRIAKAFGVSRPAVSQWLSKTAPVASDDDFDDDDGDGRPAYVQGVDGKSYPVEPAPASREPKAPVHPWAPKGRGYKALQNAKHLLDHELVVTGLDQMQSTLLVSLLGDVIEAAEAMSGKVTDAAARVGGILPGRWDTDDDDEDGE
jgi:hypothetical protein